MKAKIAIITDKPSKNILAWLCKKITGRPAYHIGFLCGDLFYSQGIIFAREQWAGKYKHFKLFSSPVPVYQKDLDLEILDRNSIYGIANYLLIPFRKFKFAKEYSRPICSQRVDMILRGKGWGSPFTKTPSPADFERLLSIKPRRKKK